MSLWCKAKMEMFQMCIFGRDILLKMHCLGWMHEAWWVWGLVQKCEPGSEHCTWLWSSWACCILPQSFFWVCSTWFCSFGDPDGSPAVQAATERSSPLDVQLLNHKRRQGSERRRKINPVHRAYPHCTANLLTVWLSLRCTMAPHPTTQILRNKPI